MTTTAKKTRDPYLDFLKGVAMLGVIMVHFGSAPNSILDLIAKCGAKCPQLFFIVSAFLTWKALDKSSRSHIYKSFYSSRFIRIAPIYFGGLIVALLIPSITIGRHTIGDYLSHILFLNGFFPQWTDNIMHVEWYIADLAIFYLLCPVLKRVVSNLKTSIITLLVSIIVSAMSLMFSNKIFAAQIDAFPSWESYFHTYLFLHQLPVWMLGVVIYYLLKYGRTINWGGVLLGLFITVSFTVGFELLHLNKQYITSSLVAGVDFAWLFLFVYRIRASFHSIVFTPVKWIGKHSFGIYCFHSTFISVMFYYSIVDTTSLKGYLIGLFVIIIVSSIVGFWVEELWNKLQKKLVNK